MCVYVCVCLNACGEPSSSHLFAFVLNSVTESLVSIIIIRHSHPTVEYYHIVLRYACTCVSIYVCLSLSLCVCACLLCIFIHRLSIYEEISLALCNCDLRQRNSNMACTLTHTDVCVYICMYLCSVRVQSRAKQFTNTNAFN